MAGRPPRLGTIFQSYDQPLYFVTFNTHQRRPLLANPGVHDAFVDFAAEAERRNIAVGRYVIMPDHVHLFVAGDQSFVLQQWIRVLKRVLSKAIAAPLPHWQQGFFDHLIRSGESYAQKWEYVRENPVRAGLVTDSDAWPYQGEFVRIEAR
jgi:putative transposase